MPDSALIPRWLADQLATEHSPAYWSGYKDAATGAMETDCPWGADCQAAKDWMQGFQACMELVEEVSA